MLIMLSVACLNCYAVCRYGKFLHTEGRFHRLGGTILDGVMLGGSILTVYAGCFWAKCQGALIILIKYIVKLSLF
jgi:hypothetical protein